MLADVQAPWYVAAGWAIDLFLGGDHREHEDLEIAVGSSRFGEIVAACGRLEVHVITRPTAATPVAEAQLEGTHQSWVLDPEAQVWRFDVFREPSEGDTWICRRDESIRLPFDRVIAHTDDGIPYGRPEIILLYKAKHAHRDRDQTDFEAVLPRLDSGAKTWLAESLEAVHPGHAWLDELS